MTVTIRNLSPHPSFCSFHLFIYPCLSGLCLSALLQDPVAYYHPSAEIPRRDVFRASSSSTCRAYVMTHLLRSETLTSPHHEYKHNLLWLWNSTMCPSRCLRLAFVPETPPRSSHKRDRTFGGGREIRMCPSLFFSFLFFFLYYLSHARSRSLCLEARRSSKDLAEAAVALLIFFVVPKSDKDVWHQLLGTLDGQPASQTPAKHSAGLRVLRLVHSHIHING